MMNKWTVALAATGVIGLASAVLAEESHPVNTLLPATTLSGYVDTSAIWNLGNGKTQATRFNNTGADRQDGFNLNVVKLQLEKALDEGTWSAGYKAELWAGPDAVGLPGRNIGDINGQLAIKQAYVALRAPVGNGIDIKIGQFDPVIGYEVADSYANPNFSRSFGFAYEPLGHTGVLASYQFSEVFGVAAGVANTYNGRTNEKVATESRKTFMSGITIKAPESLGFLAGSSLYAGVIDGGNEVDKDTINLYAGASIATPIKALSLGLAYDYVANLTANGSYANAYAVYASYQLTEKLKANLRGEYANNSGGLLYGANDEKITGLTATIDYALWANVVTRAEFRWDHIAGGSVARPFDGQKNDLSAAVNVIYKF